MGKAFESHCLPMESGLVAAEVAAEVVEPEAPAMRRFVAECRVAVGCWGTAWGRLRGTFQAREFAESNGGCLFEGQEPPTAP